MATHLRVSSLRFLQGAADCLQQFAPVVAFVAVHRDFDFADPAVLHLAVVFTVAANLADVHLGHLACLGLGDFRLDQDVRHAHCEALVALLQVLLPLQVYPR